MKLTGLLFLIIVSKLLTAQVNLNKGTVETHNFYEEIAYEKINGKLIIPFTVEGQTYRFLLDTGAPMLISSNLATKLGYGAYMKIPVSDQSGKSDSMSLVYMRQMKLGEVAFDSVPALVSGNILLECYNIDGFVGSNLLRHVILQFDDQQQKIAITDQMDDRLGDLSKPASDLFLDAAQSGPYIRIQLKNKRKAKEQLLFDSGMNDLYDISIEHYELFQDQVKVFTEVEKGYGNNSLGLHGTANDSENRRAVVPKIQIGKGQLKNVSVQTTTDNNSRVGSELLAYGIVTLDFIHQQFYFTPHSKKVELREKKFPISPTYANGQFIVGIIWDPERVKGISTGDPILSINGVNYADQGLCELVSKNSIFDNQKIKQLDLVILHEGEKKEISIFRQ